MPSFVKAPDRGIDVSDFLRRAARSVFGRLSPSMGERLSARLYRRMLWSRRSSRFRAAVRASRRYGTLGRWAVSENGLRAFVESVDATGLPPRIVEFGAGVSTVFLDAYYANEAKIDSFEHQEAYARRLRQFVAGSQTRVHLAALRRLTDEDVDGFFSGKWASRDTRTLGEPLPQERYGETRIPNLFYELPDLSVGYNAAIVDGPNGNGRRIAFPVLRELLSLPAVLLIDDVNHYEFLSALGECFHFNIPAGELLPLERWVVVELAAAKRLAPIDDGQSP
jgi:hypothetical protein